MPIDKILGTARSIRRELEVANRSPAAVGAGTLAAAQYLSAGIRFVTAAIAARKLGPADYGTAAMIMAFPSLVWSFASVKSVSVTTRYISQYRAERRFAELLSVCKFGFLLDLLVSGVAVLLVFLAAGWWAKGVHDAPGTAWLAIAYAASFPFCSFAGTGWAILSSWMRFRSLAVLQALDAAFTLLLVGGMLAAGMGVGGLIIGMAVGQAVAGLAMAAAATHTLEREKLGHWWKFSFEHVASMRRELGSLFGWNYLLVTLSGVLVQVPVMLLGRFRSPQEAGFFRLATSISVVGSYMESSLVKVAYPVLSARWVGTGVEGGADGMRSALRRWTLRGGLPLGILLALAIPLIPVLVPPVFGAGYRPMIGGTQLLLAGMAVSAVVFWLNPAYFTLGRIDVWTKVYAAQVALVIGAGVLLIPGMGFVGMAGIVTLGKSLFVAAMLALLPRCLRNAA